LWTSTYVTGNVFQFVNFYWSYPLAGVGYSENAATPINNLRNEQ
jgi:hypothetical protein